MLFKIHKKIRFNFQHKKLILVLVTTGLVVSGLFGVLSYQYVKQTRADEMKQTQLNGQLSQLKRDLSKASTDLNALKNQDQYKRNESLQSDIKNIEKTYTDTVAAYEQLLKLKEITDKTDAYDASYSAILTLLSKREYATASALLAQLKSDIANKQTEIASTFTIPKNVVQNNTAPANGYQRQSVQSDMGSFMVDIIAADLNTARVVVDTASDGDCKDNCPVMPVGDYAARSGAFAAVNGPYFCPASYPSCAGKTNSFDTLLMNKNKHYFNSDNNVYSVVPAVIFSGNSARYVTKSLEWGRDTSVDSVIANQPLLVLNGNIVFGGDDEAKRASKGTRAFIGSSGNTAYIGVVYNANTVEMAHVLKTMGIQNALNLDSGGSIALWSNGRYIAGPGRALPFGILFVRK